MSVILDALRKLDREKSLHRSGKLDIATGVLRDDLPRARKRTLIYLAAVSLATAVITYAVVIKFGFPSRSAPRLSLKPSPQGQQTSPALPESALLPKSSSPAPVEPPPPIRRGMPTLSEPPVGTKVTPPAPVEPQGPRQQVSPALPEAASVSKSSPLPLASPPVPSQQASPVPLSQEPARDAREKAHPKIDQSAESKAPATSTGEKKAGPQGIPEEARVAPQVAEKPAKDILSESATTPPSLKISGIVWSEDPSNRLAVVNGITVTEGAVIEGVKVLEIYPTRVRFLHNQTSFDVPLGSATVIRH